MKTFFKISFLVLCTMLVAPATKAIAENYTQLTERAISYQEMPLAAKKRVSKKEIKREVKRIKHQVKYKKNGERRGVIGAILGFILVIIILVFVLIFAVLGIVF